MGYGNCGTDSKGRGIGYMHEGVCDHPGCNEEISRGMAFACGGTHGDCGGEACEGYFCYKHLTMVDHKAMGFDELMTGQLCPQCVIDAKKILDENINDGYHIVVGEIEGISLELYPDYIIGGDLKLEYKPKD